MSTDAISEARAALEEIRAARLDVVGWAEVERELDQLDRAIAGADEVSARAAVIRLHQAAFEGKVRGRLAPSGGGSSAPLVVATKRTSALPAVGMVCAALLMAVGWALGGGVVLAATAIFAVFILVVAVAGSRVAHRQQGFLEGRPAVVQDPEPPPHAITTRLDDLRTLLDSE